MISASEAFHAAVRSASPNERVLCLFSDPLYGEVPSLVSTMIAWTDEDIASSSGIQVEESVNGENNLTIGQVMSSTFSTQVFNDDGLLTNFNTIDNFNSDCAVYIGIEIESAVEDISGIGDALCIAFVQYESGAQIRVTGHATSPLLRIDGIAAAVQPTFPVSAIFIDEDYDLLGAKITCIGAELGDVWACYWKYGAIWQDLETLTWNALSPRIWSDFIGGVTRWEGISLSTFMAHKLRRLALSHRSFSRYGTNLYEFLTDGYISKWEYKPLGVFQVEKPRIRNQFIIGISAYDKIIKFDINVSDFLNVLDYPITLGQLFDSLCEHCGVREAGLPASHFLNSEMLISQNPNLGDSINGREVLGYIAEIACCNARMSREGQVRLSWYSRYANFIISPSETYSADIASYQVNPVTKLDIQVPQDEGDPITVSIGDGNNVYHLSDNPLLKNKTAAEIRAVITPIYNRIAGFSAFTPVSLSCICDWTVQAGDIITLENEDNTRVPVPIYIQKIMHKGVATVYYENSGDENREEATANTSLRAMSRRTNTNNDSNSKFALLEAKITALEARLATLERTNKERQYETNYNL